jgi:hypothetical protein
MPSFGADRPAKGLCKINELHTQVSGSAIAFPHVFRPFLGALLKIDRNFTIISNLGAIFARQTRTRKQFHEILLRCVRLFESDPRAGSRAETKV